MKQRSASHSFCAASFLAFFILSAAPAGWAHTPIKKSTPAPNATLATAPETIALEFAAPVRLMSLELADAEANPVDLEFNPSGQAQKAFSHILPAIEAGKYTVTWRAMGADGHKLMGKFQFTVGAGDNSRQAQSMSPHSHDGGSEHTHHH